LGRVFGSIHCSRLGRSSQALWVTQVEVLLLLVVVLVVWAVV
jgi:hypothetical protein